MSGEPLWNHRQRLVGAGCLKTVRGLGQKRRQDRSEIVADGVIIAWAASSRLLAAVIWFGSLYRPIGHASLIVYAYRCDACQSEFPVNTSARADADAP